MQSAPPRACCKRRPCGYAEHVGSQTLPARRARRGLVAALVVVGVTPFGAPRAGARRSAGRRLLLRRAPWSLLRAIAADPRPMGSEGAARRATPSSRTLEALDLAPHVQTPPRWSGAERARGGHGAATWPAACRAATLRAPSCSSPTTIQCPWPPAPPTTAAASSTLLEAARALASGPPPRNDVIFLFTDGEERGLLGASAFLRDDAVGLRRRRRAELRQPGLVVAGAHVRDQPGQRPPGARARRRRTASVHLVADVRGLAAVSPSRATSGPSSAAGYRA